MKRENLTFLVATVAGLVAVTAVPGLDRPAFAQATEATTVADPAFLTTWTRTDLPVASRTVTRSWYWGPIPNSVALYEDYDQGPNGKHLVQYFDKSRMEINDPNANKNNPFYVTNGLLAYELITGQMQVGDNSFIPRWPAEIPIAGDTNVQRGVEPTYSSFRGAISREDAPATGRIVNATIGWNGTLDFEHGGPGYLNYDRFNVKNAYYEQATKHNIPDVFWTFLNESGPIVVNGRVVHGRLSDPYFYVTGYPVSDAYWSSIIISGQTRQALIQPYQRRVLTYVPDNPAGFKVEMGNVGQHYYDWRYKDAGKSPALAGTCQGQGAPTLGFGKLYNENTQVKINLGCQQAGEQRATIDYQPFEHGQMIAQGRFDFYSGINYEDIFVLFNDGTAKTFPYVTTRPLFGESGATPVPGATPTPNPPAGLYAPEGNFGTIWYGNSDIQQKLGWATAFSQLNAVVKDATGVPQPGTGGAMQQFEGGEMVYPGLPLVNRKIFVLYNNSGYGYIVRSPHLTLVDVNRWNVYDDTFEP